MEERWRGWIEVKMRMSGVGRSWELDVIRLHQNIQVLNIINIWIFIIFMLDLNCN